MSFEKAKAIAQARSYGRCEGCGLAGQLDPHHRATRGMGGVHGTSEATSNDCRNILMLCRPCHDSTLEAAPEAIEVGWVIERRSGVDPLTVPARIHTVNGYGWWRLRADGGYEWELAKNMTPDYLLIYTAEAG